MDPAAAAPGFWTSASGTVMKTLEQLTVKIFADGADLAWHDRDVPEPAHQGLHDQPDADAQGRHSRLPRLRPGRARARSPTGRSRSKCSPTSSTRWSGRRVEIAAMGKERLREDPGHQHARRVVADR